MSVSGLLLLWTYLCLAVFLIATIKRVHKYMTLPRHLRWELYPVKHEVGKKAEYGGSYLEEDEWWNRKKESSLTNELKFMVPEILFVRGLYEENRPLWYVSFPFHFGLYMLLGTFGLLVVGALGMSFGMNVSPDGGFIGQAIYYLTILLGFIGVTLGTFGSFGLIYKRLTDKELRPFTTTSDFFNLGFFALFFTCALAAWLFADHSLIGARTFVYKMISFGGGQALSLSFFGGLTVFLASFAAAYIPLTHMSHMYMKYFMYHDVRWEDEPNLSGSKLESQILANLGFKPTWSASHIKADGTKTWTDLAISNPTAEEKQ